MRLLGRGLTRKGGVTLEVPQGLSQSVGAVLPPSSRWQHGPTVPSLGRAGLVGEATFGPSLIPSVLL